MSNGLQEDIKNTIKKMKNPTGMMESENWLRHTGEDATICDEMLLIGATKDQIAKAMLDRGLKPNMKKALLRVQRHFKHLMAAGKSESQTGHNLPLIEDSNGKWCFDLKKLEEMHNGITHPVSNPTILKRYLPKIHDVDHAEEQRRKTSSDEVIGMDAVLDQLEDDFKKAGKPLKENWRDITKQKIKIWFRKKVAGGSDAIGI